MSRGERGLPRSLHPLNSVLAEGRLIGQRDRRGHWQNSKFLIKVTTVRIIETMPTLFTEHLKYQALLKATDPRFCCSWETDVPHKILRKASAYQSGKQKMKLSLPDSRVCAWSCLTPLHSYPRAVTRTHLLFLAQNCQRSTAGVTFQQHVWGVAQQYGWLRFFSFTVIRHLRHCQEQLEGQRAPLTHTSGFHTS